MKRKNLRKLLILTILAIVCFGFIRTPVYAETASSSGPFYITYGDSVYPDKGVCEANVACGTPVSVKDGVPITNRWFKVSFGVTQVCTNVHVNIKLPEGFVAPYRYDSMNLNVQRPDYEIKPWHDFMYYTSYLEDAKPGKTYYVEFEFTGNIDLDNNDWETSHDRVPFTQTIKVPFLVVKDCWNTVTVTDKKLGTVTLNWDDSVITDNYNQKAAEMAAVMSQLAYDKKAMVKMLTDLGCGNIKSHNMGINTNQIGVFTGEKVIVKGDDIRKVIFAVGRGTNGLIFEWLTNLNVGSSAIHRGFHADAKGLNEIVSQLLNQFEHGYFSDSFVFYTGHSQAAAAANLAAHWASWDRVAYTFATPTVEEGIGTETSGEYGIYNWVYYQDAIRNAPTMLQYGRYGSTHIFGFDTPNTTGDLSGWTDKLGLSHPVRRGFTLQEYLNAALLYADVQVTYRKAVPYVAYRYMKMNMNLDYIKACHSMEVYWKAVTMNLPGDSLPHMMQRTIDASKQLEKIIEEMEEDKGKVVQHTYYCPVNVYVYDQSGNLAGSIEGNQITINDENLILYSLLDSKTVMYGEELEGSYRIEVTGYADGEVTHSTTWYSMEGTDEMLVSQTIPVSNGQTISFATDPHGDSSYTAYANETQIQNVVCGLLGIEPPELTMPFTDVAEGKWYYESVEYVYNNGLMNGTSDTLFDPNGSMTRAMLATVIYRATGSHALPNEMPFTDVPAGKWYTDAINWAYINKIVNGTTATAFSPNDKITREQIVTMFYRYAQNWQCDTSIQADLSGYRDAGSIANYAKEPFRWAVAAGIINGTTDTTLEPKAFATRAQCAAIMQRFNEYIGQ